MTSAKQFTGSYQFFSADRTGTSGYVGLVSDKHHVHFYSNLEDRFASNIKTFKREDVLVQCEYHPDVQYLNITFTNAAHYNLTFSGVTLNSMKEQRMMFGKLKTVAQSTKPLQGILALYGLEDRDDILPPDDIDPVDPNDPKNLRLSVKPLNWCPRRYRDEDEDDDLPLRRKYRKDNKDDPPPRKLKNEETDGATATPQGVTDLMDALK